MLPVAVRMIASLGIACLVGATAACGAPHQGQTRSAPKRAATPAATDEDTIGVARMERDGTVVLTLRAEGPHETIGDGVIVYPPSHDDYQYVLDHLGGLEPGEEKMVRPFPPREEENRRIVLRTNTQATIGDVRIGAGNFWERDYTDEQGTARRGPTASLAVFVRRPDLPEKQTSERVIVWPGRTFEAGEERFLVESVTEDTVTLVRLE